MCRSDAGCGYNQLVYSGLVGMKQQDRSLFDNSLLAARSVNFPDVLYSYVNLVCAVLILYVYYENLTF